MDPKFLSLGEVLAIYRDQIARHGGSPGIRDMDLVKSAAAMPSATYGGEFLHTDIFEMAASYLFHLVKNHPFVDGNKRAGVVAALVFLDLNGYDFTAPEDDLAEMVLAVARGEMDKARVAVFIREWSKPF
ncbi:MAG: type II toxin-antitoxin system death-on-curing family toxin [Deltaproteobacteria bacterium]|nr:type II toxin-antitoxin system death-on-curing family toxin [Deltaproteobacteria bacterium]